ncbi:SCO family protein [Cohnella abietis]|uniref:Cysteine ABC transporter ATP-binding protein n=1 Tax=Cohnella abietis TaxID=2507935 RepID=A0A3T1D3X1_9BACL|nr:SCO family protein [Cohnella abietis]BBI32810.1 cysteine ABC transporter ATP-binding protein [Cohnella abietis]
MLVLIVYFLYSSKDRETALPVVQSAPEFALTNLDGQQVNASDNKGKIVLMEFMFTSCPDICPLTTYKMVQLQEQLKEQGLFGNEVQFVAITFDPKQDTPEMLKKYADRMKMDMSGWHVLRGEEEATKEIAKQYGVMVQNMGDGQFVHTVTSLNLIDSEQKVRKVYSMGDEMNNEVIMADIVSLLSEKKNENS